MPVEETNPPSLADLEHLFARTNQGRADTSLAQVREEIGGEFDPTNLDHVRHVRRWLNQWVCRIGYPRPGQPDLLAESLAAWWEEHGQRLPSANARIDMLTDPELESCVVAFEDLAQRPAFENKRQTVRAIGPTAAAKVLFLLRPAAITAWDAAISERPGVNRSFRTHLSEARDWARALELEADRRAATVADAVGRPGSTTAKVLDEYLYLTVTRHQ